MLRIGHAADLGIVRRTPDAGAAAVHDRDWDTQPPPDLIHSANHGLLRLYREPAAAAAGAPEFLPGEVLDVVPERPGFRRVTALRLLYLYRRTSNGADKHFLSSRTRNPVHGKPVVRLKCQNSSLRILTVDSIDCAR